MHGTEITSAIIARKAISSADVTWLRQEVFRDGVADDKEVETLFRMNEECVEKDESWSQLFVDALTDYFVWQTTPRGYVDEAHARYLIQRIVRNNRIESTTELELLVNIVHWAVSCPAELSALVLSAVRESVLEPDEAAYGRGRRPKVVDLVDIELIKRAIYAPATAGGITVRRAEADAIFDLNDGTVESENNAAWKQLFVYAIGNHLMFPRPHTPPPVAEEVLRREEWLKGRRGTWNLLGQIGSESLKLGAGQVNLGERFEAAKEAMRNPKEEPQRPDVAYERETIDEEEASWLISRIRRDGQLDANEIALLSFIRNTSPNIHASLEPILKEAGV